MSKAKSLSKENSEIIGINADGNCLFRSLVSFTSTELYNCKRNRSGVPSNRSLQSKEINLANSLRFFVVNYIERNKDKYKNEIAFDPDYYDSIDDRVSNMFKSGEFGGILEIDVAADFLKIKVNIYVIKDDEYNLVYSIGESDSICNLHLDEDHYELIKVIDNNTAEIDITELDTKTKSVQNKLIVNNCFLPKFKDDKVKCMPYSLTTKKSYTDKKDGVFIYDKNNIYRRILKNLGNGCSKKLDDGWFFWDNITKLQSWAEENDILWLS